MPNLCTIVYQGLSLPAKEEWIEIPYDWLKWELEKSLPAKEEWIEMYDSAVQKSVIGRSLPAKEEWIEIH